jgi:hypothetical protein
LKAFLYVILKVSGMPDFCDGTEIQLSRLLNLLVQDLASLLKILSVLIFYYLQRNGMLVLVMQST